MHEKFEALSEQKKNRIISAALEVFGKKPYKDALIEDIAAIARVSKGSIFFYFKSKKQLYFYLIEYCGRIAVEKVNSADFTEADFFKRIEVSRQIKMSVLNENPKIDQFLRMTAFADDAEIDNAIKSFRSIMDYRKFFKGVDTSKFKDGIALEEAIKLLFWTLEGVGRDFIDDNQDFDTLIGQYEKYMRILKTALYREEYINE